ncbi:dolichol kinase isoform X2 [Ooceraea biroi]|uniref:dolichol kinase n=1 Tax=Ooceraea biroi TaxID=2015173 RepID=A0A026VWV9_OOCBI|nr:dolichol kinase isoform X2 [Ooceraea biroi]EZA48006.1 Dolichol kinase [Ooceraea biroi]
METLIARYKHFEEKILQNVKRNGIQHRPNASSGLWLGTLVGLSAVITILREENSYSEICLLVGITGFGLVLSTCCLYTRLSMQGVAAKDFHVVYFLPAIVTSMLFLLAANRGLLTSVTWGVTVGSLGTWGVLQLMSAFPYCFTMGEATAVMHSCILFLMSAVTNLPLRYHLPPIHDNDISTVLLQVGILYVMSVCLLCGYFPILHNTKYFYSMTVSLLCFITVPLLCIILDQNPVMWIITFMFNDRKRAAIVAYWAVCLLLSIFTIMCQILSKSQATSSCRKSFHILAIFVYIPGMIYDPSLLYLASGVMLALFIALETIRLLKIPPLGEILHEGFTLFVDEKDSLLSLTAIYLLCGLSFSLWMPTSNLTLLVLFSGVLTIGIGDTAANFVGCRWGSHKWVGTEKTIEGTVACVFCQVCVILGLTFCGFVDSHWLLLRSILAAVSVSLIEARTNQVDNLALPLFMYVCLMI